MFWSKNKKKYVNPSKPHFFYIKVGCKGVYVTRACFRDDIEITLGEGVTFYISEYGDVRAV